MQEKPSLYYYGIERETSTYYVKKGEVLPGFHLVSPGTSTDKTATPHTAHQERS